MKYAFWVAGFDLCSCTKTQRVVIRCRQYNKQPKAQHQGSADRSYFSAAVCIDGDGHRYKTMYCSLGEVSLMLFPGTKCIPTKRGYFTDEAFELYVDFLLGAQHGGIQWCNKDPRSPSPRPRPGVPGEFPGRGFCCFAPGSSFSKIWNRQPRARGISQLEILIANAAR